ncbi:hypothetical protein NOCARDAX2BIS_220149 [Nocardioides sp. AX2bis]|nr:hypothetical protein NOCARDAX2BIS_220149 [Nocardioides sp. AX2bis]
MVGEGANVLRELLLSAPASIRLSCNGSRLAEVRPQLEVQLVGFARTNLDQALDNGFRQPALVERSLEHGFECG